MARLTLPQYPYDLLRPLAALAEETHGQVIDLSIGDPTDPTPSVVQRALAAAADARAYPASAGSQAYLDAARSWLCRVAGLDDAEFDLRACIGTKEFVASAPRWLDLLFGGDGRDVVLVPELRYPTYEMGAALAGLTAVTYRRVTEIPDEVARRALAIWVCSPHNPTGELFDLGEIARWGREHGVIVLSDECYIEFTWSGYPHSILEHGCAGVLALHSLSKRSNFAGGRAGFFAGAPDLVAQLGLVRNHAGLMVPHSVQAAAVAAWNDTDHVARQRDIYRKRLDKLEFAARALGGEVAPADGGFYVWARATDCSGMELAERIAHVGGAVCSLGTLYGSAGDDFIRLAAVAPDDQVDTFLERALSWT